VRTDAHVEVAGRVGSIREHRKLVFVTLIDVSGSTQLLLSAAELEPAAQEVRDRLDLGDWLGEAME
jgi:lysyl-tRNA synthetase class II